MGTNSAGFRGLLSVKLRMLADGKPLFEIALGEVMQLEGENLRIDLRSSPIVSKRGNLVGFPGILFQPSLVEAPSARYAVSAWSWLDSRMSGSLNRAAMSAMAWYYLSSIRAGFRFNFAPMILMQLSSRLYALSQRGVPIDDKLTELRRSLRGITSRTDAPLGSDKLFEVFDAANSEAKVAGLLTQLEYPVSLGVNPDIIVSGIGIEVKNALQSYRGDLRYLQRLRQKAQQIAQKQDAQIVIFDAGQYFHLFGHDSMKPFSEVMKYAMWRARKNMISAILLSDSPVERSPRCRIV